MSLQIDPTEGHKHMNYLLVSYPGIILSVTQIWILSLTFPPLLTITTSNWQYSLLRISLKPDHCHTVHFWRTAASRQEWTTGNTKLGVKASLWWPRPSTHQPLSSPRCSLSLGFLPKHIRVTFRTSHKWLGVLSDLKGPKPFPERPSPHTWGGRVPHLRKTTYATWTLYPINLGLQYSLPEFST